MQETKHRTAIEILSDFYEKESIFLSPEGGDFSILAENIHPDCVMYQSTSLPYGGEWKGPQGFHDWMKAFGETFSRVDVIESEMLDCGDVVVSRITADATARATGKDLTYQVLQYVKCVDGQLYEFRPYYWDIPALLEALG
ncbi:nuclear transport factor 2 family protein [Sphingobium sp. 15-1]|uniref:nuclear transport factor 2 family protein n=1 Tax=Sphingobium sp. 15-1 TaxID=2729616 RepID=UPI00159BF803|nr:nuclear transport factor 2 family protein [Sphingobium sp. 15-1]